MALDGFFFNALIMEIQHQIAGSRVEDVYDSKGDNLILRLRSPGQTWNLEIPRPPSALFLAQGSQRRKNTSSFSQTLKKHLAGLFCSSFTNPPFDRRATLALASDLTAEPSHFLHIEVMGRNSDVILCLGERIIASTRKRGTVRSLQPGDLYLPPPLPRRAMPANLEGSVLGLLLANCQAPLEQALVQTVLGISPLLARELRARVGVANISPEELSPQTIKHLAREISQLGKSSLEKDVQPVLYAGTGPYWTRLTHLPSPGQCYSSLSAALAIWQAESQEKARFGTLRGRMERVLSAAGKRVRNALSKQGLELERAQDFSRDRQIADTLLTNLNRVPKGSSSVTLPNPYTGDPLTISLNPRLSASANAAIYYKKYHKFKDAAAKVQKQIATNRNLLVYLQSLEYALETAESSEDLDEVLIEIQEFGLVQPGPSHRSPSHRGPHPTSPLTYRTQQGTLVLVGKNNRQNERLLRGANKDHYWLHCRHSPGSHVILSTAFPDESELTYAAGVAAWHSKERSSPKVEVVVAQVKDVKKIPGTKRGLVRYYNYRSLNVEPSLR